MMLASAVSAIFIRDDTLPNLAEYTPIHIFIPFTFIGVSVAYLAVIQRQYMAHRKAMQSLYWWGCVVPGVLTLLPHRLLGSFV
jgi:uncharacterized membrane protein